MLVYLQPVRPYSSLEMAGGVTLTGAAEGVAGGWCIQSEVCTLVCPAPGPSLGVLCVSLGCLSVVQE